EKVDFTISFDDRRAVRNEHGNRLVEAQSARFAGTHGSLDAIFAPCRVIAQHELGEFHRLFDTDASVAEIASRPREQSRGGRVVQVDVLVVGEDELDIAQGVAGPWPLPDAPLACPHLRESFFGELADDLAVAGHELEALLIEVGRVATQLWQGFAPR